jgi:hypothetical protein
LNGVVVKGLAKATPTLYALSFANPRPVSRLASCRTATVRKMSLNTYFFSLILFLNKQLPSHYAKMAAIMAAKMASGREPRWRRFLSAPRGPRLERIWILTKKRRRHLTPRHYAHERRTAHGGSGVPVGYCYGQRYPTTLCHVGDQPPAGLAAAQKLANHWANFIF